MRIVLVNWAKIWDGFAVGGGINGYAQGLALELAGRGHEVSWLCGGTTHVADPATGRPGRCEVRRHPDWLGIRVFEVVNSPVLAPSLAQFRDPLGEVSAPALEAELAQLFRLIRPDVVHFHGLEGFSAGCIDAARGAAPTGGGAGGPPWRGARVFASLHNYHPVCPQVYLLQNHRRACLSYRDGHACVGCVESGDPAEERARRASGDAVRPPALPAAAAFDRASARGSTRSLAERRPGVLTRVVSRLRAMTPAATEGGPTIGPVEIESGDPRGDSRGRTQQLLNDRAPLPVGDDPDWRPVSNKPTPDPPTGLAPTAYAERRRAMLDALGRCDRVLAVSEFVRAKYAALGLAADRLTTLHIGTTIGRLVARAGVQADPPPFEPPRAVRMVFIGYNNWAKGLPMLADAFEMLPPPVLARVQLSVYALNGDPVYFRFRRLEPRLARLIFRGAYQHNDLPWLLAGQDLGLVTPIWWDNAPQTVMEFHACRVPVLAAAAGGIPDFVRDGENGLLFPTNDRAALARRLAEVVENPGRLGELRRRITPPKDMAEHAAELERLYAGR